MAISNVVFIATSQRETCLYFIRSQPVIRDPKFAEPLREELRENAEQIAKENNIQIEFIRSAGAFRKEDRIKTILQELGTHPGVVHIFSAMEPCPSYSAWHDKPSGRTMLKYKVGNRQCLLWENNIGARIARPLSDIGIVVNTAINNIHQKYESVCVDKYVIMPNHIHMILFFTGQ